MKPSRPAEFPRWMSRWLIAAGVYNLAWGGLTVLFPNWLFGLTGLPEPSYPFIWQCVGMIVGVFGVGYLAAARDPLRHWPIVLVGFLGKVFGPIGYLIGLARGEVPGEFGITLITNDLIWWVPFGMMLYAAFRSHSDTASADQSETLSAGEAIEQTRTESGGTLGELSRSAPVMVVFLRHAGCTFCKEAMADIGAKRAEIEQGGHRLVLVHMGPPGSLDRSLSEYNLAGVETVSDPMRRLYRAFELGRGSLGQLFGFREFARGISATLRGHVAGKLEGDGFQMPGLFVIQDGRIIKAFRHRSASDRPDYTEMACELPTSAGTSPA